MGCRVNRANLLELFALSAVASPFAGYGVAGYTGRAVFFILGAGVFCTWMLLTSVLFVGQYKQTPAPQTAPDGAEKTEAFDTPQTE